MKSFLRAVFPSMLFTKHLSSRLVSFVELEQEAIIYNRKDVFGTYSVVEFEDFQYFNATDLTEQYTTLFIGDL